MKIYVSNIVESYKDTIIGHFGNADTADLILHIVQCGRACEFDKENCDLPRVFYCSGIVCKYHSCLGFIPIKHNEEVK